MDDHQGDDPADGKVLLPSEVSPHLGVFDRFATRAAELTGRASFFLFCVLLVAVWLPSIAILQDIDTWQLIINTATTIITFLTVALLQNTQTRSDLAVQHKLNAIAEGLADLMKHEVSEGDGADDPLAQDRRELRAAVGLEHRESSNENGD